MGGENDTVEEIYDCVTAVVQTVDSVVVMGLEVTLVDVAVELGLSELSVIRVPVMMVVKRDVSTVELTQAVDVEGPLVVTVVVVVLRVLVLPGATEMPKVRPQNVVAMGVVV